MRPILARAAAALVALATASATPAAAQTWYGTACAADGSACASAWAVVQPGGASAIWNATVTFNRVGAIRVIAGAISSPTAGIPSGGTDLNTTFCCAAPGETVSNIYDFFGVFTQAPTPGATYFVPVGVMTLPAGDPRTAEQLEAELVALGFPSPSLAYGAYGDVGLRTVLASVAVVQTPEPATLALVAGGLALVGVAARRRGRGA